MPHYNVKLKQNLVLVAPKLIENNFTEVNEAIPSNPCAGSLPRIKISFFLLSTCIEELISIPKTITLLQNPPLGCEKASFLSNPIQYPKYLYLLMSAFLFNQMYQTNSFLKKYLHYS